MPKPKLIVVPALEDVSPRIAELRVKLAELSQEDSTLRNEEFELARTEPPAEPDNDRRRRVAEILGDAIPRLPLSRSGRLGEIATRRSTLRDAIETLLSRIAAERRTAGATIREQLKADYHGYVAALASALVAVHSAHLGYRRFIDALEAADVPLGDFGDLNLQFIGSPTDADGPLARFFSEVRNAGMAGAPALPAELSA